MSKARPRRGRCQACHETCRTVPIESMVRKTDGDLQWWEWRQIMLCPPCRVGFEEILCASAAVREQDTADEA